MLISLSSNVPMGFTAIESKRQLNIDTAPFFADPYSQRESKKGISGHDTTVKAKPCGIVFKEHEALFLFRDCHVPND
jgi:hypothetical protein